MSRIAFLDAATETPPDRPQAVREAYDFSAVTDVPCFVAGTNIRTPGYDVRVESLTVGDAVMTKDHGAQIIRWIGKSTVQATPLTAPVEIAAGAFGNTTSLCVSPLHQILLSGWRCSRIVGAREIIIPALHLVNGRDITQQGPQQVTYYHLAFDRHEIIMANGVEVESFHPDNARLSDLDPQARNGLFRRFPNVSASPKSYGPKVRPEIKPYEARLIRP